MIIKGTNQSAVVAHIVGKWQQMKGERISKELAWKECWQAYQSQFGQTWSELQNWRSKRYLPLTFQAVESQAAQRTQFVMPDEDFFRTMGRTPEDDQRGVYNEALMKYQFYKTNFHNRFHQLMKQAAVFGNAPYCVVWKTQTLQVPDFDAFQVQYETDLVQGGGRKKAMPTKDVMAYDGPELIVGNIFDFVIDRFPDDPSMAFRINRTFRRKSHLDEMNKNKIGLKLYENLDEVRNVSHYQEPSDSFKQQVDAQLGLQPSPEEGVDLLQAEGDFYVEDASGKMHYYKNHIAVVANKKTLIRFEPNPYLHGKPSWQLFKLYDDPNETYGKGDVETVLSLQDIANVRMNQMIESATLNLNKTLIYQEDGVINPEALISVPNGLIATANVNNIRELQVNPDTELALRELGFIMSQFNQTTGADQAFTSESYKKSATEVANQAQAASARDQFMVRHIEQDALIPILSMWLRLNQQMMDRPTWVRIIGDSKTGMTFDDVTGSPTPIQKDALEVGPDDIAGDFDVIVTGSTSAQKTAQETQATIQFLQIVMQSQAQSAVKLPYLLQDIAKLMRLRESWRWLKTPMEMQIEQQQQMAQQLALRQASPGGNAPGSPTAGGSNEAGSQPGPAGVPSMAGQPSPGGMSAPGAPPGAPAQ